MGNETPYRRIAGNVFDGTIVEAGAVHFHAIDVEVLPWARFATIAASATSMNSSSPATVGAELRVANTIVHDNNVGARNGRVGITGGKELTGIGDCQNRKGGREEL